MTLDYSMMLTAPLRESLQSPLVLADGDTNIASAATVAVDGDTFCRWTRVT